MINRLLVANRGEIARRVFATCRALGVETVAVHSDADAAAPFVLEADQAVRLPGNTPAETYLRVDLILDAARRSGADAVHPGYGFLAENAEFAAAVTDAGLTWVGPPAKVIGAMGDKLAAKALLADAGVPMLPSWTDTDEITDFPVLVKASAGGGGRGMRIVRDAAGLAEAVASARREAAAAFGDGTVFIERYVERGRHVEVQIFGDTQGRVVALGDRECSIQRRHQKIVEEAPAVVPPEVRTALHEAAVAAGRAVDYLGAGTVEFLLAPGGEFFFLEMNTRLQVEHPVTELCTGLDLVGLQLLVAEGEPLPAALPASTGHAIEVRLCAEDAAASWRPATGTLHRFAVSGVVTEFGALAGPGLRLDSGVVAGSVVGVHYDSMLAKLVAWGRTRAEATRLLATALARAELHGLTTNRDLLVRVLRSTAFAAVEIDTGFLERHPEVFAPLLPANRLPLAALAAALASAAGRRADSRVLTGLPSGWRNVPAVPQVTRFAGADGEIEVRYRLDRTGGLAEWSTDPVADRAVALVEAAPGRVVLDLDGVRHAYGVHRVGSAVFVDGPDGAASLTELPRFPLPTAELAAGSLLAPLPGAVTRVHVQVGQRVAAGDPLLTLEAMKLEHPVLAPTDGVVAELPVPAGGQVRTGAVLAVIDNSSSVRLAPHLDLEQSNPEEDPPMTFDLTPEQDQLRDAVRALGRRYGHSYFVAKAKSGEHTTELWTEAGQLGYLGVNIPTEYGGGGGGITELAIVCEELAAAGCPLLLLVVSPAIAATILSRHGTEEQRKRHLPGLADGSQKIVFAITEPEAGSNFHRLGTVARRDGDEWLLSGRKCYISGVDEADHVLVVARTEDAATGKLKPALFIVPTDAAGLTRSKLDMEILSPENQFLLYLDDVRLPADALVGESLDAGLPALFAGLNPERITVAAMGAGTGRYAIERASEYTATRKVWGGRTIGSHQAVSHPLAHAAVQVELARLMIQKAATLYDAGRDLEAGVAGNMAKYASGEAAALAVDTAVQALGGAGMTTEYGVATLLGAVRAGRIAPVSREMILNFVAQHVLGQDKSY